MVTGYMVAADIGLVQISATIVECQQGCCLVVGQAMVKRAKRILIIFPQFNV
jgi:hypothetical protein